MILIVLTCHRTALRATPFNASSNTNVAVYFGKSPGNSVANLMDLCSDSSVDIVSIGFIRSFTGSAGYPTLDLVQGCKTPASGATTVKGAQISCPDLARNITVCQKVGKKMMISIGGSSSNTTFASATEATNAANMLWKMFGPATTGNSWRPFGSTTIDGIDIGKFLLSLSQERTKHVTYPHP